MPGQMFSVVPRREPTYDAGGRFHVRTNFFGTVGQRIPLSVGVPIRLSATVILSGLKNKGFYLRGAP
jgi:hypothetical protein